MHYDKDYFEWQKDIGEFGGYADSFKFKEYITPEDTLLDFGCGGGNILSKLNAKIKYGIEINETAREESEKRGIITFENITFIENNSIDKIISHHALEHVFNPLETIIQLKDKLKTGGKIILVVPHEDTKGEWKDNDINMHLYTWNQMTLGNLFKQAGYKIEKVEAFQHQWPKDYFKIAEKKGWDKFHKLAEKTAKKNDNYQIKIVATK